MKGNLQRWILGGLLLGLVSGLIASAIAGNEGPARDGLDAAVDEIIYPLGGVFLRLLFMTVLPLVFSCLTLGIRELGNTSELGRIGVKTLIFTLILTTISVLIGLFLVNTVRPGDRISAEARERLLGDVEREGSDEVKKVEGMGARPRLERIVQAFIPRNPVESAARAFDGDMLAVMVFALLFGLALGACGSSRTGPLIGFLEGLYDVSMWLVALALKLAPIGVTCLVFSMAAKLGTDILLSMGAYVLTVLAGLAFQQFVVYTVILRVFCRRNPLDFFSRIRPVMATAFSTSSSNATLPTTLVVARTRLGIPPRIANFVLTLGSTFNQNGTALFEGVTVLFIAQFFGVELRIEQQLQVLAMSVLAGVGTAGVPGGSIPLIVPVLVSVGVPGEGIAVILGVDRLLDMCRTVLNVTGDLVVATFVAQGEEEAPPATGA
ncbi:MAG TPA: dicarboxylate/amino acid:cation symporter [Planctomycetota bacterium]|nr:dicarboxylate/amino acid:cation symporter [Planctomycetota bacterium]